MTLQEIKIFCTTVVPLMLTFAVIIVAGVNQAKEDDKFKLWCEKRNGIVIDSVCVKKDSILNENTRHNN